MTRDRKDLGGCSGVLSVLLMREERVASTFNIYPENSCSIASVADRGQQLEVITHGTPVEVTKPLPLGNVTAVGRPPTP
jgi:hypothetical protein